jgi:hypothetical protein
MLPRFALIDAASPLGVGPTGVERLAGEALQRRLLLCLYGSSDDKNGS